MLVRTPAELGALIHERRRQLKMDQATLARRVGASRQWVIEIERGHPRAELGLVLRTLDVLGIKIDAENGRPQTPSGDVDIDAIVAKAKRKRS